MLSVLLGCASTHHQKGTGEYLDDGIITDQLKAAVPNEPDLRSCEITGETFNGAFQMKSFVASRQDINRGLVFAKGVKGATAARNAMLVKGQQ